MGTGLSHLRATFPTAEDGDTALLFQLTGGLEVCLADRISLFGEYRYERADHELHLGDVRNTLSTRSNLLVAGITYRR
jgi:opacity protein-like surface antigen